MHQAFEIQTEQRGGVVRKAYRLDPPFHHHGYDDDGEYVELVDEYVVLSKIPGEVMAFPGVLRRTLLGREHVLIASMAEADVLRGDHSTRDLLTQMGYRTVTDIAGRTTVKHEDGRFENQGRWGQGGPGSDDYMSFGS